MKNNFKMNKIAALVASGVLASAAFTSAHAASLSVPATLEINNNITMALVNGMNFGQIIATGVPVADDEPILVLNPQTGNATPTDNDGQILVVNDTDVSPAEIAISDVAPNVLLNLEVSFADAPLSLTNGGQSFSLSLPTVSVNDTAPVAVAVAGTGVDFNVDAGGAANLKIGGTLTTVFEGPYTNGGAYSANFTATVNY